MAFGASGAETTCRTAAFAFCASAPKSGSLDHFAVAEAARADANPLCRPVDRRAHSLKVGFKPPGSHIVGVRNRPSNCRALVAHLAPLRHDLLVAPDRRKP